MKTKYFINTLILCVIYLLATGCEKKLEGFVYNKIYVYEDGNLVDAQEYVVELPSEGGFVEKEFVTYGITGVRNIRSVEGISAEFLSSYPPSEDELYSSEEPLPQYKQSIKFKANPNNKKKSRNAKFMIVTIGFNGYAANIYVKQPSK